MKWADPLCQGPTPAIDHGEEWYRLRARFISENYGVGFEDTKSFLSTQDRKLEEADKHDKIILWFEHDLFDQSILIFLLQRLNNLGIDKSKIFLININNFPGVDRFIGLGQLESAQLKSLFEQLDPGKPVSDAQFKEANQAWRAFSAPSPAELLDFIHSTNNHLPFLRQALLRHLAELPAVGFGVNKTEELVLAILNDAPRPPAEIFNELQAREESPWLGDTMFWPFLRKLLSCNEPLLHISPEIAPDTVDGDTGESLRLSYAGKEILSGKKDHLAVNSIQRHLGGVSLNNDGPIWRWDNKNQALVYAASHG